MAGHVKPQTSSRLMLEYDNVAGGRLSRFTDPNDGPPTGFKKDGYCRITDDDKGMHGVAATVSESFLKFTNGNGNTLDKAGVKPGMKWCLCASRWKEAYDAFKDGKLDKKDVPQVHLHATDKKVLDVLEYGQLKQFRAPPEATQEGGRQGTTVNPESPTQSVAKHGEMSGTRPTEDQQYGKTQSGGPTDGASAEQGRRSK